MCDTVWVYPQSHSSLSVKPHFLWHALQWPWPVRKRFSSDHWRLWRSKPGSHWHWPAATGWDLTCSHVPISAGSVLSTEFILREVGTDRLHPSCVRVLGQRRSWCGQHDRYDVHHVGPSQRSVDRPQQRSTGRRWIQAGHKLSQGHKQTSSIILYNLTAAVLPC